MLNQDIGISVGWPRENPAAQLECTTYFRIFAQSSIPEPLSALKLLLADETMQHFSGTVHTPFPSQRLVADNTMF